MADEIGDRKGRERALFTKSSRLTVTGSRFAAGSIRTRSTGSSITACAFYLAWPIVQTRSAESVARYALEGLPNKVMAAEYRTTQPDEELLAREIEPLASLNHMLYHDS